MRKPVRLIIVSLLLFFGIPVFAIKSFQNETLKYVISYKWGLIHKEAGEATLSLRQNGTNYNIVLTAKTKPWADKIYQVRDTLISSIRISDLKPLSYVKLTHENGEYKKDEILYSFSGNYTTGIARRYRKDKNVKEKMNLEERKFSASGPVYDMLSIFYYLRCLDYAALNHSTTYTATVFSGKQKETIKIKYLGKETIKLKDKSKKEAYHIRFNFTRDGGKKSSDDMDTWISTDSSHIPLYLVGKLPVGEIRAELVGN